MKRTIGLVAAVILVGAFVVACNQKPAEPASTSVPSPTPAATAEPATTPEPSPSAQPVDQDVVDHGVVTEGQEPVNETDEAYDAIISAHEEETIQNWMNKYGVSREEAESWMKQANEESAASVAEREENRQQYEKEAQERIEAEQQAAYEQASEEVMDKYGLTLEQWQSMTPQEQYQWAYEHQQ